MRAIITLSNYFQYRNLLRYERKIEIIHTRSSHIKAGYIQEKAVTFSLEKQLDEKGLCVSLLEEVMDLADFNDEIVYTFEDVKKELLITFKKAILGQIPCQKKKRVTSKEAFEFFLQAKISGNEWMSEEKALDFYPNEYVLVQFFIEMMKG